ncbi:MAG: alpha-L-fucosidase [Chlorobi bacterium]|nr:alpha-L-fucosidase [Chlorobiota bacterium]
MKTVVSVVVAALLLFSYCSVPKQEEKKKTEKKEHVDKMQWWKEAKFGMFIHWGVYSVPAGVYKGHKINGIGEWIMNLAKIPVSDYRQYANSFNPVKYNPEEWVNIAKDAGMRYIVITSKHHDGFGMFDSKVTDWDIVDATPYKKDVIAPLIKACRKDGMHVGLYYSQAQDWVHPGGAAIRKPATKGWKNPDSTRIDKYTEEHDGHWDPAQEGDFDKYLDEIAIPQVKEILKNYGKIDVLWWDTPKHMTKERAARVDSVISKYPDLITNNRLGGGIKGDLETPEQFIPATGYPGRNWEVCMTMNDTWGYKSWDNNWKSGEDLLLKLSEIVSKGGNFLLNVGPTDEGLIPQPSIDRLKYIGKWMKVNGESIYGTTASPFPYLPWGRATRKGNVVYLHVYDWPADQKLALPVKNKVKKAYLLADKEGELEVADEDGKVVVHVPENAPDSVISVVVIELEGEPEVLPVPTSGKKGIASSEDKKAVVSNLFDGNPKNRWMPEKGVSEAWVEVDLGEPVKIGHVALVEPWHTWSKKSQEIELQVKDGDVWKTILNAKTKGTGFEAKLEPVTGQYFRLKIKGSDGERPVLNEWILHRTL